MKSIGLICSLAAIAAAQMASPVQMQVAAATVPAASATQTVMVGGSAGLVFSPPTMVANPGTQVDFVFLQKNHSVFQSTLQTPCQQKVGGFTSGFMPNPSGSIVNAPKFSIMVNDTQPVWVFCAQDVGTHCGHSMVFAINPNPDVTAANSFRAYQQSAIQQNGTGLMLDPLVAPQNAQAAAVASTVTVDVAGAAAATGSGVAAGSGSTSTGEMCTCACQCQPGAIPQDDAVGNFGGWAGMLP